MKLPLAAFATSALILAGCSTTTMDATASAVGETISHPVNAAVNGVAPLPQETEYTYWRKIPGTNVYESIKLDHRPDHDEMIRLGIIPPDTTAPAPAAQAAPAAK